MRPRKETPLSVAERVRRYAEKKKGEDPESWLEKGWQRRRVGQTERWGEESCCHLIFLKPMIGFIFHIFAEF